MKKKSFTLLRLLPRHEKKTRQKSDVPPPKKIDALSSLHSPRFPIEKLATGFFLSIKILATNSHIRIVVLYCNNIFFFAPCTKEEELGSSFSAVCVSLSLSPSSLLLLDHLVPFSGFHSLFSPSLSPTPPTQG